MRFSNRVGLVAGAAALTFAGVGFGDTNGKDNDQDLRARVAQMEAELSRLKAENGDQWLTEQRAAEIRGIIQDVLADADTRASLLQGGASAGHDGHFFIASADGNFRLNVGGQIQFRHVYNTRDDDGSGSVDENRRGFEVRRAKLVFSGNVIDPSWTYRVQGGFRFDGGGGDFELQDAYLEKEFDNGLKIRGGQFKLPFLREELVSSKYQLAVDRSVVNELYNQDRASGIQVSYEAEKWRAAGAFSDGFATSNTSALTEDTEIALTGRVEVLLVGESWDQFSDFTSWQDDEFGLLVGGAFHYEKDEYGTASGPELERFTWTIDGSAEFGGANVYAAVVGNSLDDNVAFDADMFGVVIQGGYFFVPDKWEVFARYEWSDLDIDPLEDISIVTIGVNRYFSGHSAKWTTDIGFSLEPIEFSEPGIGYLADAPDEDGQVVIRTQFQLLF
jgi:hypothetical protein